MSKFSLKIKRWWLFNFRNQVVKSVESGGFRWNFRRFWLEIETLSGNFKARFTAAEHPYGYLLSGDDDQTRGFAERVYMVGYLLTTDQKFVDDIDRALKDYNARMEGTVEEEVSEEASVAEVKKIQEYMDANQKRRRKMERDANGRFKKVVKDVQKGADGSF